MLHLVLERVLDLDGGRSSQSSLDDIVGRVETLGSGQSSVSEALENVLLEGEVGCEGDFGTAPLDIRDGDRDRLALTRGVGQVKVLAGGVVVFVAVLGVGQISLEGQSLVFGIQNSDGAAVDTQRREDGQRNLGKVEGARAGNNEKLERRPSESSRDRSQEGRLRGDLLQEDTVVAILFTFLANDGGDELERNKLAIHGEELAGALESTQDDGREGLGEVDGILKRVDRELVLARRRSELVGSRESGVGGNSVFLFLLLCLLVGGLKNKCANSVKTYSEDSLEDLEELILVVGLVSGNIGCDVVDQRREISSLEKLVESNKLESGGASVAKLLGELDVGDETTSHLGDLVQLVWVRVGESIVAGDAGSHSKAGEK